jgi:hypothetical protein
MKTIILDDDYSVLVVGLALRHFVASQLEKAVTDLQANKPEDSRTSQIRAKVAERVADQIQNG